MKTLPSQTTSALAALLITALLSGCSPNGMADYAAELDAAAKARAKDPAWKPTHQQVAVIKVNRTASKGTLQSFCLNKNGEILACWDAKGVTEDDAAATSPETSGVQVYGSDGEYLRTWPLPFGPQTIAVSPSGTVFVGGHGQLARLGADGRIEASGRCPALDEPMMSDDEIRALIKDWNAESENQFNRYKQSLRNRRQDITGLAATERDVFLACAAPKGFSYAAYRMDHDLRNATLVVEKLSGCCGQMDIAAREDHLWVAHNGRHRVECYDRNGKQLSSFGRADRRAAEGFGGCCEPKNIRLTAQGTLLCAESGPPVTIKQFTAEGKFMEVVANPTYDSGCVRATVDVSPDGGMFYLLNSGDQAIHVFAATP